MNREQLLREQSLQWWAEREHAMTVPCPDPGCEQPVLHPCVRRDGDVLFGSPAHGNRIRDADRSAGLTTDPPPPPDAPFRPAPARKVDPMHPDQLDHLHRPCNHCRAPILWATTRLGDRMPIDATPVATGNVLLSIDGELLRAGILGRNQAAGAREHGQVLYQHHKLSCPHADRWCRSPQSRRSSRR